MHSKLDPSNGYARCVALLGALLLQSVVCRAEPLSRGAAVARALKQNPQLLAARAVEEQAEARHGQVAAARFPTVSLTAGVGPSLKARLVPGSAVESTENAYGDVGWKDLSVVIGGQLQVTQPLYTFGKIDFRDEATQHEMRARKAQTEMTRADLAYSVAELYEGLLFARDSERFLAETDHWLSRTIENTVQQLAADTGVTEQDLARLQAGMGAVQLGLTRASAAQRQAQAALVAYLGFPVGTELTPSEDALQLLPAPKSTNAILIALALKERPELRALMEGSQAQAALARAEEAGNLPDFFAMLFASAAYTPGRDLVQTRYVQDPLNGFYPGLLVGARWQLTGPMASRRADEKQAMARELDATRLWAQAGLPAQVTAAFEDIQRAVKDVEEADKAAQVTKQWLMRESADWSIGMGDSRNLADAATAFLQLRIASYDARYRHNVALAALARATGTFNDKPGGFYPTQEH
jgi:outer membrane protein TolC